MIEQARLLVPHAADRMDKVGNMQARGEMAMTKVTVPKMLARVSDVTIQAHGAADEVHRDQIGRLESRKYN